MPCSDPDTYRYLMTDREYHWLEMTVIKADDPETGDILGIAFCHSVDDEKQMEEQLLVERRVTYDSLPGGVIKCMMSDHPVVLNMSTNLKRLLSNRKRRFSRRADMAGGTGICHEGDHDAGAPGF